MTEMQSNAEGLTARESRSGDAHVLELIGFVDLSTAPVLDQAIARVLEHSPRLLVIDLRGLDFLGSAGLTILAHTHTTLAPAGRLVVVANELTARPLEITGLDKIFDVRGSVDEAVSTG